MRWVIVKTLLVLILAISSLQKHPLLSQLIGDSNFLTNYTLLIVLEENFTSRKKGHRVLVSGLAVIRQKFTILNAYNY